MKQTVRVQTCCILVTLFDLSTVTLRDRRLALVPLLDNFEDNSIFIIGKCFKRIAIFTDVAFRLVANLFRKTNQTPSADSSRLNTNGVNIIYKEGERAYLWVDPYVTNFLKNLLYSKLDFWTENLAFSDFYVPGVALKSCHIPIIEESEPFTKGFFNILCCAGSKVLKNIGSVLRTGGGHTLPVAFEQEIDENCETILTTYVVCNKESNYDKPATPNYDTNCHDGKNTINDTPEKRTRYTSFKQHVTRLATFRNCDLFTDIQTFANLGFFYKGLRDSVCCYECGITLSNWEKGDDPLLEHIRYSPECRHLATVIDPVILASTKSEFQSKQVKNSTFGTTGVKPVYLSSQWNSKKIRSPEYSSYSVRLSTFARFPVILGVNVCTIAKAGFYYTGRQDIVRCYACDGGLTKWVQGDDAWEEHYKWFPDCPYLQQLRLNPSTRITKAEEGTMKPTEATSREDQRLNPSNGFARRRNPATVAERNQLQDCDPDMYSAAALAVQERGFSKRAIKMAIHELRKKGRGTLTALSILNVLLSYQDKGINLPTDDME